MHRALGTALLSASLLAHAYATVRMTRSAAQRCTSGRRHDARLRRHRRVADVPGLRRAPRRRCLRQALELTCIAVPLRAQVNAAAVGYSAGRVAAYSALGGMPCVSVALRRPRSQALGIVGVVLQAALARLATFQATSRAQHTSLVHVWALQKLRASVPDAAADVPCSLDGGLCANGGVFVNGVCLPPTQEYMYGGVGAVVRMRGVAMLSLCLEQPAVRSNQCSWFRRKCPCRCRFRSPLPPRQRLQAPQASPPRRGPAAC